MILIRGGQVIDGTGRPPFKADIIVKGSRISAIGEFYRHRGDTVVDAAGGYVTPGFIDVHSDSDHYLSIFTDPEQDNFLRQGVTTTIGGHCGSSLAPLLYGSLESIRKWTDTDQANIDWHSVPEFFHALSRRGIGVNFGTLVGHSTVRRALIGETSRDLTVNELKVFRRILGEALEGGAFGLSTGLGYAHSNSTPYHEMKNLAEVVRRHEGVYATHLRNERDGLRASVDETVALAKETGVKTLISHLRPIVGYEDDFTRSIQAIEQASRGADIHFDSYPFDTSLIPLYTLLPPSLKTGNLEAMLARVKEPHLREKIAREFRGFRGNDLIVVHAMGAESLAGKTLGEFAAREGRTLPEALIELMTITKLKAVVLYRNVNMDLAIQSLLSDRAFVASNGPSRIEERHSVKHERLTDTFPKFLSSVVETGLMPIEKAIAKITSAPAKKFNLKHRGDLREGNAADIVVVKEGAVTDVFVNGVPAVSMGMLQGTRSGTILRKS